MEVVMSVHIDELVEDGRICISSAEKHLADLKEVGVDEDFLQLVQNKLNEVRELDTGQKGAKTNFHTATREQNSVLDAGLTIRSKVLHIAGLAFRTDAAVRKEFKTGTTPPKSLHALRAELDYMQKVVAKRKAELKKRGLKDADIEQLAAIEKDLSVKDDAQSKAEIAGTTATEKRNKAAHELRGMLAEIRAGAEIVYQEKNPEVLKEFASRYPHHAKGKNNKKQGPAPPDAGKA
jgi:hypothetical protein